MTKAAPLLPPGWVKARLYHLFAPLAALIAVAFFEQTWMGDLLEDQTVNLRFKARAAFDPPADPRLIFVGIDQQSLDKFGRYPWPRTTIAHFLTTIAQTNATPHTAVFDILYTDKSSDPADDVALGNAVALLPSVITGALSVPPSGISRDASVIQAAEEKTKIDLKDAGPTLPFTVIHGDPLRIRGSNVATLPVAPVRTQSLFGFVNDEPSPADDIRHTIPLLMRVGTQIYPSLALQALCQMLDVDADKVEVNVGKNVVLKNASGRTWTVPIDARGEYAINYRRNSSFDSLSFGQLSIALDDNATRGVPLPPPCNIAKKTLVIGEAATGLTDLGPTPLRAESPLVYTHLNVINNVLKNDYLSFVPWYWVVVGWALVTWPSLLRLKDAPLGEAVLVPIALVILYAIFAFGIFWLWSVQVALAWPVLSYGVINFGGVILRWREEQRGRQQLKQIFSKMLPSGLVNHLLDHPENLKLGGSMRPVTILFSDIRDYTGFSENIDTEELVRQLNTYFERMVDCVEKCRGTFHKFIGDAVMAVWGDLAALSLGPEEDAQNAVRSALMMRLKLRELNVERRAAGQIPLRIGIGLNHGDVAVAQIGASIRSEFTVMGDPVNVASRLEGITKEFHTDLAVSESVRQLLGDDFLVRRLGFIQLKGKTKATVVFEVLAEKSNAHESAMNPGFIARYEEAFDHFLARRFAEAETGFLSCEKDCPDDYCVKSYLQASREFSSEAPPPEWDGRIVMKTK
jgi:adenylate cyclase